MPDPARSHELEHWIEARPLTRKIVCVRMRGQWLAEIRDDDAAGCSFVGSGRSLHDAIEAAQDEQDSAARRAGSPPRPALRAAVLSSLVDDTEPVLSSERDTREVDAELRAELLEATLPSDVPELCSCGRDWPWSKGEPKGVQHAEGESYEMRNCPHCGSTRMRVLAPVLRSATCQCVIGKLCPSTCPCDHTLPVYSHPGSGETNRAAARESLGFLE